MARRDKLAITEEQERDLLALSRSSDRGEADRARAMLMSAAGSTGPQIGQVFGVRADQVRKWRSHFREGGVDALRARPRTGRPDTKAKAALAVVKEILSAENATLDATWTCPRLAKEVEARTGVSITAAHLSEVLRKKGDIEGSGRGTRSRAGKTKTRSIARV
jgi:transposase